MALSGYFKQHNARRNGGIKRLGLIQWINFIGAQYDYTDRAYTGVTLQAGEKFTVYEFQEDEAEFQETVETINGAVCVTHELRFLLDRMGYGSSVAMAELLENSYRGLMAVITTYANESFLIGYSPEFGKQRPLHVARANATTGKKFTDPTSEIIVLQSLDTMKAQTLSMNVDTLFKA